MMIIFMDTALIEKMASFAFTGSSPRGCNFEYSFCNIFNTIGFHHFPVILFIGGSNGIKDTKIR